MKFYYHGTTLAYHSKQIKKYGCYRHDTKKISLGSLGIAVDWALFFSGHYNSDPVLLVVSSDKVSTLRMSLLTVTHPLADEIPKNAYVLVPLSVCRSRNAFEYFMSFIDFFGTDSSVQFLSEKSLKAILSARAKLVD